MKTIDYNQAAPCFDLGNSMLSRNMNRWLGLISNYSKALVGARVLDLGCGTGRFALPMAERLRFNVTGADASEGMLAQAKEKDVSDVVRWDHQSADDLTYSARSFDVVFMSHLLHHLSDPPAVIVNCKQILADCGVILIRYGAIEQIRDDAVHRFFPEALALDEVRTPTVNIVEGWLRDAGFKDIVSEEIAQQSYETGMDRLRAIKAKNISVLNMISQRAFENGICALKEYVSSHPDDPWLVTDCLTLTAGYVARGA